MMIKTDGEGCVYGRLDEDWCWRFLFEAWVKASWSKDPVTQCGAVVVDPHTKDILGSGYNGFPPGSPDDARLANKTEKNARVLHAEDNALWRASAHDLRGKAIFIWPSHPCPACTSKIIRARLGAVFYAQPVAYAQPRVAGEVEEMVVEFGKVGIAHFAFPRSQIRRCMMELWERMPFLD